MESWPIETDFGQADLRDAQGVWLELINGARKEILWHTFYVSHKEGESTGPVLEALEKAAARGVRVQLLVDEQFYKLYPQTLDQLKAVDGIELRLSPVGRWYGAVMHAKMILVDGERGFVGSQNFDWRSLTHIRELGVLIHSPDLVRDFSEVFRWEWEHHEAFAPPKSLPEVYFHFRQIGEHRVAATVSPSPLNSEESLGDEYQILRLLNQSKKSIEVALLSYDPLTHHGDDYYPKLEIALRRAAVRGVKIRMLLGHWVEEKDRIDHLLSLNTLKNVEIRACRIPLAKEGEIEFARVHHSKYLVCDGKRAWLGTSNWAKGYFHSSRNYGLVFWEGPIPQRLERLFDFDWERSTMIQAKNQK